MNKIIIENDYISFDDEEVDVQFNTQSLTIDITNNVVINELNDCNIIQKLLINIHDNSTLTLNIFNQKASLNLDIEINIYDNGKFYGNIGLIANTENHLNVTTNMFKDNIENILNIKGISKKDGYFNIKVDGNVQKNTYNNMMKESIKILNLNAKENKILPNMLVATNEVKADHFVTISNISEPELFYLMSKGINRNLASKILEKAFIFSLYDEKVKKIIDK